MGDLREHFQDRRRKEAENGAFCDRGHGADDDHPGNDRRIIVAVDLRIRVDRAGVQDEDQKFREKEQGQDLPVRVVIAGLLREPSHDQGSGYERKDPEGRRYRYAVA